MPSSTPSGTQPVPAAPPSALRRLSVQFSHFFSGSMLSMLLGLLTFPILTRLLSAAEYGMLGIITLTVSLAVVAAKGGLSDAIVRFLREYLDTPQRRATFTATVVLRGAALSTVVTAAYLLLLEPIMAALDAKPAFAGAFAVMALYLWIRPLNIIVYNYLRALGHTVLYNVISVGGRLAGVALSMLLLVVVTRDLRGYFLGTALAELACGIVLFAWLFARFPLRPTASSGPLSGQLTRFGLPLVATELAYLLLRSSDRYLVAAFLGDAPVGMFAVASTLPNYISDLVIFSLSYAIVPIFVDLHAKEGAAATARFLERALRFYLIGMILLCAGYAAVATDAIVVLASEKYREAGRYSPPILVGMVCIGLNTLLNAGLYLHRRTIQLLLIMLGGVAVSVALNVLLLPRLGLNGAALAALAAGLATSALTMIASFRLLPLAIDLRSVFFYLAVGGVMMASLMAIDTGHAWWNLAAKVPLGAAIAIGFVGWREPEARRIAQRLLPRRGSP